MTAQSRSCRSVSSISRSHACRRRRLRRCAGLTSGNWCIRRWSSASKAHPVLRFGRNPRELSSLLVRGQRDDIKQLVAGWDQFAADVANYQHVEEAPAARRRPEMLPALRIQVTGAVTYSNLAEFKQHAMSVIGEIKTDLQSDQDFADAEKPSNG